MKKFLCVINSEVSVASINFIASFGYHCLVLIVVTKVTLIRQLLR